MSSSSCHCAECIAADGTAIKSTVNPIQLAGLNAWLESLDASATAGIAGKAEDCPLARYCTVSLGLSNVTIGPAGLTWYEDDICYKANTEWWMDTFMEYVDSNGQGADVAVEQALAYLDPNYVHPEPQVEETYDSYEEDDEDEDEDEYSEEVSYDGPSGTVVYEVLDLPVPELEVLDLPVRVPDTTSV
jgi:hypothetical protein